MWPLVGSIKRLSMRTRVDLPEPDRPMTTKISPRFDGEVGVEHANRLAGAFEDLLLGKPLAHQVQGLLWLIAKDLEDVFDANLFGHWLSSLDLFLGVTHSAAASQAGLGRPTREAEMSWSPMHRRCE